MHSESDHRNENAGMTVRMLPAYASHVQLSCTDLQLSHHLTQDNLRIMSGMYEYNM